MNTPDTLNRSTALIAVCVFLFLVSAVFLAVYRLLPPSPLPASAPSTAFSAERALKHTRVIARVPHPAGSAANDQVRAYILGELKAMGIAAEEQVDRSVGGRTAVEVKNVLARIPGTAPTKAFAIMAHYDSVPYGPGAADDGSGVVTMLETARALKAGTPLRNDVILVFTDAEESGELGAEGFMRHPWVNEIGVIVNLEARGTGGPSLMFETSPENGWLIAELAQADVYARASSLMYDVYKRLPFDSDFSVLKRHGLNGFNVAFVDNFAYYHTKNDSPDHLSPASLQNHGSYALGLARRFGNIPLDRGVTAPDAVYFNALGSRLVHYPLSWGKPVTILAALVFLAVILLGFARRHLTPGGLIAGTAAFGVSAVCAGLFTLVALGVAYGPGKLYRQYATNITHLPDLKALYHNDLYGAAFAAFTVCVLTLCYIGFRRFIRTGNLAAGALMWWVVVLAAVQHYLPGGSYFAAWPLLFSAIGLGLSFLPGEGRPLPPVYTALLGIFALPGIVLLSPAYQAFLSTVMIMAAPGLVLVIVLILGLVIPQLGLMAVPNKWWLPTLAGGLGLCLWAIAIATSGYAADRPKLNCLSYGLDMNAGKAFWMSADKTLDEWTLQFFQTPPPESPHGTIGEFIPGDTGEYWKAPAPVAPYAGPQIQIIRDTVNGGVREVALHVAAPDKPSELGLSVISDVEVFSGTVFGKEVERSRKNWRLNFRGFPREGTDVTLKVDPKGRLAVKANERLYGLPDLPGVPPRPDYMVCEPNTIRRGKSLRSGNIFVTRTFEIPTATAP
jgi:hypothetical protein